MLRYMTFSRDKISMIFFMSLYLFIFQFGYVCSAVANNQFQQYDNKVKFSTEIEPSPIRPGENVRLKVTALLEPDWYIYSTNQLKHETAPKATMLVLEPDLFIEAGPVYESTPVSSFKKSLGYEIFYHKEKAVFYQNFKLPDSYPVGSNSVELEMTFQLCTNKVCLPPRTVDFDVSYEVEAGAPRSHDFFNGEQEVSLSNQVGASTLNSLVSKGFWAFISLAALMGLASLLTPCVFPMIPITVSYFSNQAEGKQSKTIKLASLFALGIIVTYTTTGVLLSAIFGAGSALRIAANPWVNLFIAGMFIIFAFSLMGWFDLSLPPGIANYFDKKSRRAGGTIGVLLMGFTFTLTAFTCTVQFVGTMLIAASQGAWGWPLLGMLVFSSVFAFPFFLLALMPGLISKTRGKSGAWLGRTKFVLGVLELMASLKFISNADLVWQTNHLSRNLAISIWIVLFVVIIAYLIWTGVKPILSRSRFQWGSVFIFTILTVLLSQGWNDRSLGSLIDSVLPPSSGFHVAADEFITKEESNNTRWLNSLEEAKKLALIENKKIFIEFTGYTCVNCRWMEQNILSRKEIHQKLSQNYILVRLYTDGGKNASENLQFQIDHFNTVALPYYAILSEDSKLIKRFSGIALNQKEYMEFLTL